MKKLLFLLCNLAMIAALQAQSTDSLVAWYPFNGNANDESGHGRDGIPFNTVPAPDRCLEYDKAVEFPTSWGQIQLQNTAGLHLASGPFSIVMWIKGAIYPVYSSYGNLIVNPPSYFNFLNGFGMELLNDGFIYFIVGGYAAQTRTPIRDLAWHMVLAVADTLNLYLYLDGLMEDSVSYSKPLPNTSDIFLAINSAGNSDYYNGIMDDVRIYTRAITKSEAMDFYNEKPFPVEIFLSPGDGQSCIHSTFAYKVSAAGTDKLYQWLKDGIAIPGETGSVYTIPRVQAADSGNYLCVVSNGFGSQMSDIGHLAVICPLATSILGKKDVLKNEIAFYSVPRYPGRSYSFSVVGGKSADSTENSIQVIWDVEGQGYVKVAETAEVVDGHCTFDTITLAVMVGPSGQDDLSGRAFAIWPNPAKDKITIETPGKSSNRSISILNLSGQQLLQQTITEPTTTIDISSFLGGVYVVKVFGEKGVQVGKFIKQ